MRSRARCRRSAARSGWRPNSSPADRRARCVGARRCGRTARAPSIRASLGNRLARRGSGVGGARRPHRSHADVRADVVDKRDGRAALVNEQLPFGTMSLAHQTFCQDRPAHCG